MINEQLTIAPLYFCIFAIGASIGSFLNVVSRRLLRGEAILGRSHCESCGKKIAWFDLIPLLSFILLRGKCRHCGKKLSWQYPIVEFATGLLFVALFLYQLTINNQQLTIQLLIAHCSLLIASSSLIVIFITDFLKQRVFDVVVWFGVASAFLYRVLQLTINNQQLTIAGDLLLALSVFLFFWFLHRITGGRGMGEGDPPIGFLAALLVGFPTGLVMIFLSFVIGAVVGLVLIALGKKKLSSQVPFGPFLVVSVFATIFLGDQLLNWYLGLLGF